MPQEIKKVYSFRSTPSTMWDAAAMASELEITLSEFVHQAVQEKVLSAIVSDDVEIGFRPRDPQVRTMAIYMLARKFERDIPGITPEDRDRMVNEIVYGAEPGPDRPLRGEELVEVEEVDD